MSYRLSRKDLNDSDCSSRESSSNSSTSSPTYDFSSICSEFKLISLGPVDGRDLNKNKDPLRGVFHHKTSQLSSCLLSPPQTDESDSNTNDSTLDIYFNQNIRPVIHGKEAENICYLEAACLTIDKIRDNNLLHKLVENESYEIELSKLTVQVVYGRKLKDKVNLDSEQFLKHLIAKIKRIELYENENFLSDLISQKNKFNEVSDYFLRFDSILFKFNSSK
jgi:hypothetical protein